MFLGYIDPGIGIIVVSLGGWVIAALLGFLGIFGVFFKKIIGFIKRNGKKVITFLALLVIIVVITIGVVIMTKKEAAFQKRVIILGFDGLSPRIIEPLMAQGKLPNFSRLSQEGSYRHLSTSNPSQSPVAWSGFATGQNPGKHGVFDFIIRDSKNYGLTLSISNIEKNKAKRIIQSKCFWEYTSDKKIPTTVISCPVTFPPHKVHGRMLSGMGVPDILGTQGTFSFYTSEPQKKDKDVGGKVFLVKKSSLIIMNLTGPRVAKPGGKAENVTVPFKVELKKGGDDIGISFQNNSFTLAKGQWSGWKEVTFSLGFFKKARGIVRFYLVEKDPEFKLYVSPINFDPRKPFFPISYPPRYAKKLTENLGLFYTQGMPMDTWALNEKRLTEKPFLEQANEVLREKRMMLDYELNRMDTGVLFCYFESPDIIQHMFWRYTDPKHPLYEENAPKEYKEIIHLWYQKMDSILGSVLEKRREGDEIIVLSDHGFDTFRRTVHLNSWLRKNGYLVLKDPFAESGAELLLDIDWSRTKAYAIGFGAIYINQRGRENKGIVNPGKETEQIKERIAGQLIKWQDDKYQSQVVNKVFEREEMFWGEYADSTPDLYVGFNIGYRASWQTALGGVPSKLIEDNLKKWSGSHLFNPELIPGVFFSTLRNVPKAPSIYDIAPTVLRLTGYTPEEIEGFQLDGKALVE